ncbi:MAG: FtsX-like permease family protein, partial [Bacteroidales bacterium]
ILFRDKINTSTAEEAMMSIAERYNPQDSRHFRLQALRDIHLRSSGLFTIWIRVGDIKNLYLFSVIGFLLLLVATNNYILLATAGSLKRVRETGIRKVTGAMSKDLWNQLFVESTLFAFITFPFALVLVEITLPRVNQIFGTNIDLYTSNIHMVLIFLVITLIVGIISGWYTAVFMSRLSPGDILKDPITSGHKKNIMRRGLITVQLITFTGLMVSAGFVERQIHFMLKKDLGYNSENLLKIRIKDNRFKTNYNAFRQELSQMPGVIAVAGTMWAPPSNSVFSYQIDHPRKPDEKIVLDIVYVDYNFMETMQFRLTEGRFFSDERGTEEKAIILNETASRLIGPENILGLSTYLGEIIGIVEDFHIHSLHSPLKPQAFILSPDRVREMIVRVDNEENILAVTQKIKESYLHFSPDAKISVYSFDSELKDMYYEEIMLRKILFFFTLVVIIIAALGLFGLSMFLAELRTREISIRKVHGAGMRHIMYTVIREFLWLLIVSCLLAWPASWLLISRWFRNFPYRVGFTWWIFVLAGLASLVLVFIALLYQSLQAIRSQPAQSLKYE